MLTLTVKPAPSIIRRFVRREARVESHHMKVTGHFKDPGVDTFATFVPLSHLVQTADIKHVIAKDSILRHCRLVLISYISTKHK